MILRAYEPDDTVARLERRLATAKADERPAIQEELRIRKAGIKGEREASYFLDFSFGSSKNHAVVHNLRIEHEGFTAQIDHMVINRFYGIDILETKHFASGLKIEEDGSFHRYDDYERRYVPMRSPLAQAERHKELLAKLLLDSKIDPRSFCGIGLRLEPIINCYVLVNTGAKIIRPNGFDTSRVIASDRFSERYHRNLEEKYGGIKAPLVLSFMPRIISRSKLQKVASAIAGCHSPRAVFTPIPAISDRMKQPVVALNARRSSAG